MTSAERVLTELAAGTPPVSLATVNRHAEMLARVDRKYLLTGAQLHRLIGSLHGSLRVLELADQRLLQYSSTYYDTADLATYRAHRQQRRRRYKIRSRSYLDTDTHFLEVKYKGPHQETIKQRLAHDPADSAHALSGPGVAFAGEVIDRAYGLVLPGPLTASVTTRNRRTTFLATAEGSRLTVDVGLSFHDGRSSGGLRQEFAILETKSSGAGTQADRELRRMNIRPSQVSKYCAAVGGLRPDLPSNRWHRILRTHFEARQLADSPTAAQPTPHQHILAG